MIDLLEIGVENLIEYDSTFDNTYALQLLSQPELLEELYDGLSVEPLTYGICGHGRCSNIGTVYRATDSQSGWIAEYYCESHIREGLRNGVSHRAEMMILNSPERDSILYDVYQNNHYLMNALVNRDCWPTLQPERVCVMCSEGIIDNPSYRSYEPVTAYDANGAEHIVHMGCSWLCTHCDKRHLVLRNRNNEPNGVDRIYVSLTPDLGGGQQVWCQGCINEAMTNDDLDMSTCNMCANTIIGHDGEDLEVYSELHDDYVCQACYDNGVDCDDCGYTMYNDSYHECNYEDEDDDGSSSGIHSYGYKPRPIFHGNKPPYMGFELEVEQRDGGLSDGVDIMHNLDPNEERWYLKHDGSLNYGFEIVTHPHTLQEYHKLDWSWLDKLNSEGFRSWNTSSCGLHVHIGLDGFDGENHQIRFTKFIYDNERQVKRIAGRSSNYATFDSKGKVIPKIKRKWQDPNRYSAVNVQNENTLEVRVFRGSLRKERVLSAIEFTHAACEYTRNMKIVPKQKPFSWLRFSAFVAANDDKYPNLFIIMNETFERAREIDQQEDGDDD